jgi:hypothetical protein
VFLEEVLPISHCASGKAVKQRIARRPATNTISTLPGKEAG